MGGLAWRCSGCPTRRGRRSSRTCPRTSLVLSGILHVLNVGCRWCDCPAEYGPPTTIYNRFNRWSHRGFWLKLLDTLVGAGAVTKSTAIDSTYIKAQRAAFGAKGGARRKRSAARVVAGPPRSMRSPMSLDAPMR
jgi:transposase